MIPAIILLIGLMFLPESPRWLARKDRWEETQAVLVLVHGKGNPNSPFVKIEMDEIKQMIEFERQNADVTFMELFRPNMINRLHIGIFTQIWSQLTGMNVMMCKLFAPASRTRWFEVVDEPPEAVNRPTPPPSLQAQLLSTHITTC
jgi:hypothetical protein